MKQTILMIVLDKTCKFKCIFSFTENQQILDN